MIRLETRLRKLVQPARPEEPWPAYMGDGHGTCLVPGNEQYCYVIPEGMSIPIIVNGEDAPNLPGQPVWVGKDVYHKKVIRVIGRRTIDGVTPGTGAGLHGSSHYATGGDPVSIDASQITNCLVYASTGMIAHVNEGVVNFDGQPTLVASQDVDLTSYIPGSAGQAIWALITADDSGVIAVDDSMTPVDSITLLIKSNIPAAASGKRALGAAKLYYGQTSLSKLSSNPDILPLAFMPDYYSGGGGPGSITLQAVATISGTLTTAISPIRIPNHSGESRTITGVYLDINTAPTGQALIVDVHNSGTTIFTNQAHRPEIADGAYAGNTITIDVPAWADGEYLQIQPDEIGSGVAGSDLTVSIVYTT